MARRTVPDQPTTVGPVSLPQHETELLRHYTLSDEDLQHIEARRRPRNKLGFALQLCVLRYPGRLLAQIRRRQHRVPTPFVQKYTVRPFACQSSPTPRSGWRATLPLRTCGFEIRPGDLATLTWAHRRGRRPGTRRRARPWGYAWDTPPSVCQNGPS